MTAETVDHPKKAEAAKRHRWGETKYLSGVDHADKNDRNERICAVCGMTKITVIYRRGFADHEWRTREGALVRFHSTPPCIPVPVASASEEQQPAEEKR